MASPCMVVTAGIYRHSDSQIQRKWRLARAGSGGNVCEARQCAMRCFLSDEFERALPPNFMFAVCGSGPSCSPNHVHVVTSWVHSGVAITCSLIQRVPTNLHSQWEGTSLHASLYSRQILQVYRCLLLYVAHSILQCTFNTLSDLLKNGAVVRV